MPYQGDSRGVFAKGGRVRGENGGEAGDVGGEEEEGAGNADSAKEAGTRIGLGC